MLISTQVEVVVEVRVELDVAVVETIADLLYTFPDRLRRGKSDYNAILDVAVVEAGAEHKWPSSTTTCVFYHTEQCF